MVARVRVTAVWTKELLILFSRRSGAMEPSTMSSAHPRVVCS
ncbi:hypothetical protein [Streptomyces coeruleorubidus]|nr:hypothetical protein [Streptomyces coeruleorubidus]